MDEKILQKSIKDLTTQGKGILATDESTNTMSKRLTTINVESTEKSRRNYREILFSTPNLNQYISGIILYEETLYQKSSENIPFPELISQSGIVPGIKVDKGLIPFESSLDEKTTQGLDGLPERLEKYKAAGARFAKWRVVYQITDQYPSKILCKNNAILLARYAKICQNLDIVPIVEPEVLMDGTHSLEQCAEISEKVFHQVFHLLNKYKVALEYMLLKPNMVIPGKECSTQSSAKEVAEKTIEVLRRTVPAAVPSINFLSGGLSDTTATEYLDAINKVGKQPWLLSFSFGRALQASALKAWLGKKENIKATQVALMERAKSNGLVVI